MTELNKCKALNCSKLEDYQGFCKKHYFFTDGNKSGLNNDLVQENYRVESNYHGREVRQYSFILNNSKYSDMKIATRLSLNASTEINLWLSESGNVIGLDFIQVKNTVHSGGKDD